MKNKIKILFSLTILFLLPGTIWAQGNTLIAPEMSLYILTGLVIIVALIVLGVAFTIFNMLNTLIENEARKKAESEGKIYKPRISVMDEFLQSWTKLVPIEEEKSIELDHEYDGIRELDNHLPPWWLALFYGSIVFGLIYLFGYHVVGWWPLQEEEYQIAQKEAADKLAVNVALGNVIDETSVKYNDDPAYLAQGKEVYEVNCAACHRVDGGGVPGIGPNLTDAYWLHGGTIGEIFKTITYGVQQNGMAAWEKSLSPEKRSQVTSYIYSLYGSEPANAREPQGVEVRREEPANSTKPATEELPADSTAATAN